ncbi:MAG: membrane protein insertase YidC [Aerococcaceae bacterium]|nr:membrane protein insertase YidC [Aerococcaceae bacterium]
MKQHKKARLWSLLFILIVIATGCVQRDASGNPVGWVYDYFGKPTISFLDFLAGLFGNSYGVAIIIVTIITRIFMLPSSIKMTKSSMVSQTRMKFAQPEIDAIKAEMEAATDPQEKMRLNTEMQAVYKKYGIDMFGGLAGCLPLLMQMPILSAVYAAIQTSDKIANSHFFGIPLGQRSVAIVVVVVLVYGLQGWLMQKQMPATDNEVAQQTNRTMLFMNPVMFGWISWVSAAGLGVYFLMGGVFQLIQQLYVNNVIRPRVQAELAEEEKKFAKMAPRERKATPKPAPKQTETKQRLVPTKEAIDTSKRRNEGKQKR